MNPSLFKKHWIALSFVALTLVGTYVLVGAGDGGVLPHLAAMFGTHDSQQPDPAPPPVAEAQPQPQQAPQVVDAPPETVAADDEDLIDKATGEDTTPPPIQAEIPTGSDTPVQPAPDYQPPQMAGPVGDSGENSPGG